MCVVCCKKGVNGDPVPVLFYISQRNSSAHRTCASGSSARQSKPAETIRRSGSKSTSHGITCALYRHGVFLCVSPHVLTHPSPYPWPPTHRLIEQREVRARVRVRGDGHVQNVAERAVVVRVEARQREGVALVQRGVGDPGVLPRQRLVPVPVVGVPVGWLWLVVGVSLMKVGRIAPLKLPQSHARISYTHYLLLTSPGWPRACTPAPPARTSRRPRRG